MAGAELRDFRYGAIRNGRNPYAGYDHGQHKDEYEKLANFILGYCQEEMRSTYKLKEVLVPENEVLDKMESQLGSG